MSLRRVGVIWRCNDGASRLPTWSCRCPCALQSFTANLHPWIGMGPANEHKKINFEVV